jgi:hypothetical protein
MNAITESALAFVAANPGCTRSALYAHISAAVPGTSISAVSRAVHRLRVDGYLDQSRRTCAITDAGRRLLTEHTPATEGAPS